LEPYLVPGVTDENSSIEEISSAYNDSTLHRIEKKNPQPSDRAQLFVVSFSGGDIEDEQFTSFIGFTPIKYKPSTKTPASHQQYDHAVELLSLPEKNMEKFYQFIVKSYINPGKAAEPVDITIDVVTGDGSIIQSWFYNKCELVEYTPYRDEALNMLKLSGIFGAEYSDRTVFACRGHGVDFSQRDTVLTDLDVSLSRDLIPTDEERIKKFAVHFSGGEIPFSGTSLSFSHFAPIIDGKNPEPQIGNLVFSSPQFLLSSLPNKDMESYYQWIERYINKGKQPELFDVTIDMITGDNSILQTWHYKKCKITNYVTYFEDSFPVVKFSGTFDPEFRDRAIFECNGLFMDASVRQIEEPDSVLSSDFIPSEHNRAQNIVVHFEGTEISPAKSVDTFTKFAPVLDGKPKIIAPTYPFAKTATIEKFTSPMFILESLPSKDKEWLNEFLAKYVNIGKIPELFKVRVDVVTGDGSIIQSWNYEKCQVKDHIQYFQDNKLVLGFNGEFEPEIRGRTTFNCGGFLFDGTTKQLEVPLTDAVTYVDYAPKYEDRATKYAVRFSGGELSEPITSFTFSKFEPTFPPPGGPAKHQDWLAKFTLEGISTKDRQEILNAVTTYINPQKPPEPFDVTVDVLSGDNTILQQWFYKKCEFIDAKLLLVNQLLVYKLHGGKDREYRDFFDFECNGLHVDFSLKEPDYEFPDTEQYLKDPHNRLNGIIFHMQNGERESTWTTFGFPLFEVTSTTQFSVTGLANKEWFPLMELLSRYMNPGKTPEKFDMIIDLVAGDGDRIGSLKFTKCDFSGGYFYYDDAITNLKIRQQISPELKAKGEANCAAVSSNQVYAQLFSIPSNTFTELSPREQIENGIIREDVVCRKGLQKMIVPFEEMPRCVSLKNVSKFEERSGWIAVTELDDEYITNPIPKSEDTAEGVILRFSGEDFEEEITVDTFVKYVPTPSVDSDQPGYTFGAKPLFFIDGLPSKDKSKLYEIISKSINPGKEPKNIEISLDILYGDGTGFMSLKHEKCKIERYHIFLDQGLFSYKYHGKWQTEIKDRLTMSCVQIGGGPVPI